jgi:hypothetical protein
LLDLLVFCSCNALLDAYFVVLPRVQAFYFLNPWTKKMSRSGERAVHESLMNLLHSAILRQVAVSAFSAVDPAAGRILSSNTGVTVAPTALVPGTSAAQQPATAAMAPPVAEADPRPAAAAAAYYHKLESMGFNVGMRAAERLLQGELAAAPSVEGQADFQQQDEAVAFVMRVLWPAMFGKELRLENATRPPPGHQQSQQVLGTFRLVDDEYSWARHCGLRADAASFADPFLRAAKLVEDADLLTPDATTAAPAPQRTGAEAPLPLGVAAPNGATRPGPNDYAVFLLGVLYGALSTLGFGSDVEDRIFVGSGADGFVVPAGRLAATVTGGDVAMRPPSWRVVVKHRLSGRDVPAPVSRRVTTLELRLTITFVLR